MIIENWKQIKFEIVNFFLLKIEINQTIVYLFIRVNFIGLCIKY